MLNDTHLTRLLGGFSEIPYVKKLWQILTSYAKVGHLGKSRETWGVSSGSSGKEPACLAGDTGDAGSIPGREDALEEGMATHPVLLPGESHGRGAWRSTVHRVEESDMTEATEYAHTETHGASSLQIPLYLVEVIC